jgi:hypothetical protein
VVRFELRRLPDEKAIVAEHPANLRQEWLGMPDVFEDLVGVDKIEELRCKWKMYAIEGNELGVVTLASQDFGADFDIDPSPYGVRQDLAKKIDAVAVAATQIKDLFRAEAVTNLSPNLVARVRLTRMVTGNDVA